MTSNQAALMLDQSKCRQPIVWGALVIGLMLGASVTRAATAITQPLQPAFGPGGKDYPYANVRISQGGSGYNAYYVFEPVSPQPVSAPVVIINHGYMEFTGYNMHRDLIMHTVRKGNVVIYPRWQSLVWAPCAGSFYSERCKASSTKGILGGNVQLQVLNPFLLVLFQVDD